MKYLHQISEWIEENPVKAVYIGGAIIVAGMIFQDTIELALIDAKRKRAYKACQKTFDEEFDAIIKANF